MPHQCVRCNKFYEDGAKEILSGCSCGARLFFYIKKSALEEAKKELKQLALTDDQKKQMEDDILDLVGDPEDKNRPVILDIEAIRVLQPGKYELDLVSLFKKDPLIYKLSDGKYVIDIPTTMKKSKNKEN